MKKLFLLLLTLVSCQTKEEKAYWKRHYEMKAQYEFIMAVEDIQIKTGINQARLNFIYLDSLEKDFRQRFNKPILTE